MYTEDDCSKSISGEPLLRKAIADHNPSHVFALFSGGHDSLCATHRAMATGICNAVVHINTGIGLEMTRAFVRKTCGDYGWPLIELRALEDCGQDYEAIVMEHGFPGAYGHGMMYSRLKERCVRKLVRDHKQGHGDHIVLISGVRSAESSRRMGTVEPMQVRGASIWVAINHDWTDDDNRRYIAEHGLPQNPVKKTMCMSGECLCGAFASKPELKEWVFHHGDDPGVQKLLAIREKVLAKFPWDWDDNGPPDWWAMEKAGQLSFFDRTPEHEQFLCVNCNKRQDAADEQKQAG